jgi:ATP-dependent DNA helicase RecG
MMEKAVKVMQKSIAERRHDGKKIPAVGAVLVKPDGTIETAFRGEIRNGDHAEYTLLERKHRDSKLDGSVLFSTLEPCAPGARKHPKKSCSEHIVDARINEVWVGIEDPDPDVDREGIKFLEENGVKVRMFDPDLQSNIRAANADFLKQATKRAIRAKTSHGPPTINSKWELPLKAATMDDFSKEALKMFKEKLAREMSMSRLRLLLLRQGYSAKLSRRSAPTGFGLLLFGSTPREFFSQAGLKGTIRYANGREEFRDFDGPMILIPDRVESWLHDRLPSLGDRSNMERKDSADVPFEFIREAVINALVHRDYDNRGANCHLTVDADTITVQSPGGPPEPITLEQLQAFDAPMLNRNPKIQFAFGGASLAEGRGLGMRTLKSAAVKYRLPLPKYSFDGVYLTLTIYRHAQGVLSALGDKILKLLNEDEKRSWEYLSTLTVVRRKEYAEHMGFDGRKAQRHLRRLVKLGLLRKVGASSSTEYQVQKP